MKSLYVFFFLILISAVRGYAQKFTLLSPDKNVEVRISAGKEISYDLRVNGEVYLLPSKISMSLADGRVLGVFPKILKSKTSTTDTTVSPLYGISNKVRDHFHQLRLDFKGNYSLIFRAYNEGIAYRFVTSMSDSLTIKAETSEFSFKENYPAYFHPTLSESDYRVQKVSDQLKPNFSSLPVLVKAPGMNILIHESDVLDYPCLTVSSAAGKANTLTGAHSPYPKKAEMGGYSNFGMIVKETEDFIAKTSGTRQFPWRILALEKEDKDILKNQLVYLLASGNRLSDVSWIKPGKVAWDWWNALNLTGVPFKSGINTETYKYFIDFAAANKIEYINLDEGWSDPFDLTKVSKQVDMKELIRYSREKNVGLILWCVWHTIDRQMTEALDQFQKWGIAGVKVDFMDRDDQIVVRFHERLLKEAARRKLLVNFHGAYHPTGTSRTYPNQINVEGVKGLEWNKLDSLGTSPDHDVSIPFIRMFAGSMDYTPGAMQNYNRKDWRQVPERPVSQGTRCHQMAMYIVYYAPLQMMADAPTAYEKEPEVLKFISHIPTVWDESLPVSGVVGEHVAIARRKDRRWFLGAMTGWKPCDLPVKLDFLESGKTYTAEVFSDGENAGRVGSDFKHSVQKVKKGDTLNVPMAPGGGWAATFTPEERN